METAERRGIYVCGYHASQAKLAPNAYLTGAEWNWLTAYKTVIEAAQAGDRPAAQAGGRPVFKLAIPMDPRTQREPGR